MKKIPTIFLRDEAGPSRVIDVPHPDCDWVFAGEGRETCKWDGTSCLINEEGYWKRRALPSNMTAPRDFLLAQHDPNTNKSFGWMPVGDGPEDKYHREALPPFGRTSWTADDLLDADFPPPGTYELVGPSVQGNPYGLGGHILLPHGEHSPGVAVLLLNRDPFTCVREALSIASKTGLGVEGIVWHHPDGRMAKIKSRDFGIKWRENGVLKP